MYFSCLLYTSESIGLLEKDELTQLLAELKNIYAIADKGEFVIEDRCV